MTDYVEQVKLGVAVVFYLLIWYPATMIIYPILKILYSQVYILICLLIFGMVLIIFKTPEAFSEAFIESLTKNNQVFAVFVKPFFEIMGVGITPFMIMTAVCLILVLFRLVMTAKNLINLVKMWLGSIFITGLWVGFTLLGRRDKASMFLRSTDELKAMALMAVLFVVILALILLLLVMHNMGTHVILYMANNSNISAPPPDIFDLDNSTRLFSGTTCMVMKSGVI